MARDVPAGSQADTTDQNGLYRIQGLIEGSGDVHLLKDGFEQGIDN